MIDSTLTATRVQGGWQLYDQRGRAVKILKHVPGYSREIIFPPWSLMAIVENETGYFQAKAREEAQRKAKR